ncbi:MAG: carbohydrate ABC transporter permease [Chloroflexi bacterium]|nr:carbohydrate ABC transporter permease [Chloroflexota bacterium]MBV9603360.1 carbohydrate ABC transporter permease [Chloroflexota bacterium]
MTSASARVTLIAMLVVGLVPVLLPLVWMISTSLKPEFDVFAYPPQIIPARLRPQNYADVFSQAPFARQYFSSLYLGFADVVGTAIVASLAGYALARLRFPGRGLVLPLLLSALLLPSEILIVPQYALFSNLGLIGTQVPLVLEPVFGAPAIVGTFLMRQFFLSLPRELEDAGRVDGLGGLGVFLRIALPLSGPALATLAIMTFLANWNAYLEPLVFTSGRPELITLPVALNEFTNFDGTPQYSLQMAATTLSILPVALVFLLAQRHIVAGIARSGLKG